MGIKIGVADLSPEGLSFSGQEDEDILDLEDDDEVRAEGPVSYTLHASRVGNDLIVSGQLALAVRCNCRRCTRWFAVPVEDDRFQHVQEIVEGGEEVDLTPFIRESILLRLPAHPVCDSDCKGLCPKCGADLNEKPCTCEPDSGNWGGLAALDELI